MPHFRPGERYEHLVLEAEIGRGAYAVVYRAHDTVLDRRVALKVLAGTSASRSGVDHAHALKEARLIARLAGPHIVPIHRVHDLGAGGFALEMEYLERGSLAGRLHDGEALAPADALRYLRGLASGLVTAHGQGVLHRDIKPENVLLTADGEPKLADFGLGQQVTEEELSRSDPHRMRGTPLYMAPEVIMGEQATPASDLWSLGVLGYRLLAGALPFVGATFPALFYAILSEPPEPITGSSAPGLVRAVLRCLEKDPQRRPASAAALLADLQKVETRPPTASASSVVVPAPPASVLCGREEERAALRPFLDRLEAGQGGALLVQGEAGIGKSELMRDLRGHARTRGLRWIEATVTGFGGVHQPLFRAVRRWLSGESRSPEEATAISTARFGAAAPALRTLLDGEAHELQGAQQLLWALEQLLRGLAKERPTVVLLEDAHLCDAQDLRLVRELITRLADAPVLLALTWRTQDLGASDSLPAAEVSLDTLLQAPGVTSVALGPLDPSALLLLVERRTGARHVHPEVLERVSQGSEGNPLFAQELVKHLLDEQEVVVEHGEARPGPRWGESETPSQLKALLSRRLTGLADDVRSLLDAAAVDGVQFDATAVAAVQGVPLLAALRQLQALHRDRGVVVPLKSGFRFAHATFRDVLYEELSPDLRRMLHRGLAEHMESRGGRPDDERLGFHWAKAGEQARARPYLLRAAQRASQSQQYVRALHLSKLAGLLTQPASDEETREHMRLLFSLAGVLSDLGRHADGKALVRQVVDAAERLGDVELADRALVWAADLDYFSDGAAGIEPAVLVAVAHRLPYSKEKGRAFHIAGLVHKVRGQTSAAEECFVQAGSVFETVADSGELASVEHERASVAKELGQFEAAEHRYHRAAKMAFASGRRSDAAISDILGATARLERGELNGVRDTLTKSIEVLRTSGARDRAAYGGVFLARLDVAEGNLRMAKERLCGVLSHPNARANYGYMEATLDLADVDACLGDLGAAHSRLEASRAWIETSGELEDRLTLELVGMRHSLFSGQSQRAEQHGAAATGLARQSTPPHCSAAFLAFHLASGTAFGLSRAAMKPLSDLFDSGAKGSPLIALAAQLVSLGTSRGEMDLEAKLAFAAILRRPEGGWRLAERRVIGLWLEAGALEEAGRVGAASLRRAEAQEAARMLEHAWLCSALAS